MDSAVSSQWKKIKKTGRFKRLVKKKYHRILHQSCSSLDQPACNSFNCNDKANLEETVLPDSTASKDIGPENGNQQGTVEESGHNGGNEEYVDTDEENYMPSLSEIEVKIKINEQLKIWATSFNINHSTLRELFKIWNLAIPNLLIRG